jgi:hypothetical protein
MGTAAPVYKVEGLPELRATLKRLGIDVQDMKKAHTEVASYVGAEGAKRAPRRSGLLASSWRPGSSKTDATVRYGGAGIAYANAVHWGTGPRPGKRGPHNIRATLFAVDAVNETQSVWLSVYEALIDTYVGRVQGASGGAS